MLFIDNWAYVFEDRPKLGKWMFVDSPLVLTILCELSKINWHPNFDW